MIPLSILLGIIAYLFNAIMDVLQHKHDQSIFKNFPKFSFFGSDNYLRKYRGKGNSETERYQISMSPNTWYYNFFNLKYKERFPLSATLLVFLCDGWHLSQFMMYTCFSLAIAILTPHVLLTFLLIRIIGGIGFNLFYSKILIND